MSSTDEQDKAVRPPHPEALIDFLYSIVYQAVTVRALQKEYFKTRDKQALLASKTAEVALDEILGKFAALEAANEDR